MTLLLPTPTVIIPPAKTVTPEPTIACAPAAALMGARASRAVINGRRTGVQISEICATHLQLYSLVAMTAADLDELPGHARTAKTAEDPVWQVLELSQRHFPAALPRARRARL